MNSHKPVHNCFRSAWSLVVLFWLSLACVAARGDVIGVTISQAGVPVTGDGVQAYTAAGVALGTAKIADANGYAAFDVPLATPVKFAVSRLGGQLWSSEVSQPGPFSFALPADTVITITRGGSIRPGRPVFVYSEAGVNTGYSRITDANGVARFCLAEGSRVKFRADNGRVQYFTDVRTAPVTMVFDLPSESEVKVLREGVPQVGIQVRMFDEFGKDTGLSQITDASGVARISSALGLRVQFRVTAEGREVPSQIQVTPVTFSLTIPPPTIVTVTKDGLPQAGRTVFECTAAGVPTGYSQRTDASGVARFCLVSGTRAVFRCDDQGTENFSPVVTAPAAAVIDLKLPDTRPVITSVSLDPPVFDRGRRFTIIVRGERVVSGNVLVDFRSAQGGRTVSLPLVHSGDVWVATSIVPAAIPVGSAGSAIPVEVTVFNESGDTAKGSALFELVNDTTPPSLSIDQPTTTETEAPSLTFTGTVGADTTSLGVTRVGAESTEVPFGSDGRFVCELPLNEGPNHFTLIARDLCGNETARALALTRTAQTPVLTITAPVDFDQPVNSSTIKLVGVVRDASPVTLKIGAATIPLDPDGGFSAELPLEREGANSFTLVAEDSLNLKTIKVVTIYRLTQGPTLALTYPLNEPFSTRVATLQIAGNVGTSAIRLTVNSMSVSDFANGTFSHPVSLVPGNNSILVEARDAAGNVTTVRRTAVLDQTPPHFEGLVPAADLVINTPALVVAGRVVDGIALALNDTNIPLGADGAFSRDVTLAQGANRFVLEATDALGNAITHSFTATLDTMAPVVSITAPIDGATVAADSAQIEGRVDDVTAAITINTISVENVAGRFSTSVPLTAATNTVIVRARDTAGNTGTASIAINRDRTAPSIVFTAPTSNAVVRSATVRVAGTIDDSTATVLINGRTAVVSEGTFELPEFPLAEGANLITAIATDVLGNTSAPVSLSLTLDRTAPPAPVLVAAATYVKTDRIALTGKTEAGANVLITGGLIPVDVSATTDGSFSATVLLQPNRKTDLLLVSRDSLGNSSEGTVHTVVSDTILPLLSIVRPANGANLSKSVIEVLGTVVDSNLGDTVTVNGRSVTLGAQGQFACRLTLPNGNGQTIVVTAIDQAGNRSDLTRTVNVADAPGDDDPPTIEVLSPTYDAVVPATTFNATVLIVDESPLKEISIGGIAVADPDGDGLVATEVTVNGQGEFPVSATDIAGHTRSIIHRVRIDGVAPAAPVIQRISPDNPTSETQVQLFGTAPAGLRFEIVGGLMTKQTGTVGADGRIVATIPLNRNVTNHLALTVVGANGLTSPPATSAVQQDSIAPTVVQTVPTALAERVALASAIEITFSEPVRAAGLGGIQVRTGALALACTRTLSSDGKTITLTPQTSFNESTVVEVTVPATMSDLALNAMGAAHTFQFTTIDQTAPVTPVVDSAPSRTNKATVVLSGKADPLVRISVAGGASLAAATADSQGHFTATVPLSANVVNTLLLTAIDAAGNTSAACTVSITHDDHPLLLLSSVPNDAATGVSPEATVTLTFNKELVSTSLDGLALLGQSPIKISIRNEAGIVTLAPVDRLEAGKRYEVVVPAGLTDLFGNHLGEARRIAFTTLSADAPAAPVVYTAQPSGATNLRRATVTGFATPGTILQVEGGAAPFQFPETGVIDTTGLFSLDVALRLDAQNTIVLRARAADGRLSAPVTALDVRQDSIAPTVVRTTPQSGATDFPPRDFVFVEFSEAINGATISGTVPAIRLFDALGAAVPGSWALSGEGRGATFHPLAELTARTRYRLQVANTVRDLAGNPLGTTVTVEFTTGAAAAARPEAPVLDPLTSDRTTATSIVISGRAAAGAQIIAYGGQGGATTTADASGRFTATINLVPDTANPLAFVAVVDGRVSEPATVTVTQVKHAVGIRILAPLAGRRYAYGAIEKDGVPRAGVTVCGVLDDPSAVESVTIGAEKATITGRYFLKPLNLAVSAGASTLTPTLTAVAHLKDGRTIESSVAIELAYEAPGTDTHPPVPHFIFPEPGEVLGGEVVECLVTVEENARLSTVYIDRVAAHQVVGNILFICAALKQGANTINVEATDGSGLVGTASVDVVCDSVGFDKAPTVVPVPAVTGDRVVELKGTAEPGSTIVVVNGLVPVRATVGADGTYAVRVPLNPNTANHLRIAMVDAAGNLSPVTVVDIEHDDAPPTILSTNPAGGQSGVAQNAVIEIVFSEAMAAESVTAPGAVVVTSARDKAVECNALLSADSKTLRIMPKYKFSRGDTVSVSLAASLADTHGLTLGRSHFFNFVTVNHQTTVSGIVVDPELGPLAGVRVGLLGTSLSQLTSSFGTFILDDAPVGDQILYVDARPSPTNGVMARSDGRQFNYLEFLVPVRRDADNSLGRPIFLVDTDLSTATKIEQTGSANVLTFKPATKDLAGFSITYDGGFVRFADGTTRGNLTATRIAPANIPDRLPSGAIPHFLVEVGPDRMVFDHPATLSFPNVYNLAAGAEVIVFHFKYGVHNYTELGRAKVGNDGIAVTGSILTESGFVGIVPADASVDLTRNILNGRVVDAGGQGIAGVSVNAIAGDTYVVTDSQGNYSIPLPDVRLEFVRTFATVTTDLGARTGGSPSVVFQSELVTLGASGVTKVPDIKIESFFLGGSIRYVAADGSHISSRVGDGLVFNDAGELVSLDAATINNVDIFVYRRTSAAGEVPQYDSEPYIRTKADLPRFEEIGDTYDSSYYLSFLGTLEAAVAKGAKQTGPTPKAGDVLKIVAFDAKTGFYGEQDLTIPSASQGRPGATPLDVIVNLELRPPQVSLDINRVFFLEGIRRRANVPHRGIAFTDDEYVEIKTAWKTPAATPLDRAELSMSGRLRVTSVVYQTDYSFVVRGGEHFRVLELREALVPERLSILQRDTDVGIETISVSRDGSFTNASLLPLAVRTDSYGFAAGGTSAAETVSKNVELYILNLTLAANGADLDVYGRFLPGRKVRIGGKELVADGTGKFADKLSGLTGGIGVVAGDSIESVYGEVRAPHIRALTDVPPGLVPSTGGQGTRVVINGENFSPVAGDNKVSFNGAAAPVEHATETELIVTVPDLASSGDVTVTVAGRRSNGVHFEFFSIGINNGSFEDGTFRGFTLEGSGQVVEQWKRLRPTHNRYMAFLDTMETPRDGVSSLTTDEFELPTDAKRLLFDYNLVATALLHAPKTVLEFYIVAGSKTIQVGDLFDGVTLDTHSAVSGFEEGSGFRTAVVSLENPEIPKGQRIRLRIVLKGRGALPEFIPGMNRYDHNPIGVGKNQGTGLFLDNFRLSFGNETALAPLDHSFIAGRSDGTVAEVSIAAPGVLADGARVYIYGLNANVVFSADVTAGGGIEFRRPWVEKERALEILISYGTPAGQGGRILAPQTFLRIER